MYIVNRYINGKVSSIECETKELQECKVQFALNGTLCSELG